MSDHPFGGLPDTYAAKPGHEYEGATREMQQAIEDRWAREQREGRVGLSPAQVRIAEARGLSSDDLRQIAREASRGHEMREAARAVVSAAVAPHVPAEQPTAQLGLSL